MPTLKQASDKAKAKFVQQLAGGVSKTEVDTDSLLDSMEVAIGDFISRIIDNIDRAVGKTGEPLINTGEITNISAEKEGNTWVIRAPRQFFYQSEGVSGTETKYNTPYAFSGNSQAVNVDSIKTWIRQRGIKFEGVSEDSTAFLIARSVYKNGIKPKNLWKDEVDKLVDDAGEAVANQIVNSIQRGPLEKSIKIQ